MKCHICSEKAALCFSNWPDPGEICLCEQHCSDANLYKAQKEMRARQQQLREQQEQERTRKAG